MLQLPGLPSLGPHRSQEEMAACPAIPRAVVGSILLLIMSTNPVWGESETVPPAITPGSKMSFLMTPTLTHDE